MPVERSMVPAVTGGRVGWVVSGAGGGRVGQADAARQGASSARLALGDRAGLRAAAWRNCAGESTNAATRLRSRQISECQDNGTKSSGPHHRTRVTP